MNLKKWMLIALVTTLAYSCDRSTPEEQFTPLLSRIDPAVSNVNFTNVIEETEEWNYLTYFYYYNGGGVAAGDIDNDGLTDLFFSGNQVKSRIYRNLGDLRFEDITDASGIDDTDGWSTGTLMADINGDGYLDIYLCRAGSRDSVERENLLYINNKDNTFTERSKEYGINDNGYSTHATFFDYDRDGDLDLYVVNHPEDFHLVNSILMDNAYENRMFGNDRLYRNEGDGHFMDISGVAGIFKDKAFGLSVSTADVDKDGWIDIFVANDFWEGDFLYMNQGDGTFIDKSKSYFKKQSCFSMGSDFADFNNDNFVDLMVVDMIPEDSYRQKSTFIAFQYYLYELLRGTDFPAQHSRNVLQLNNGGKIFSEMGEMAGVAKTDWSWGVLMADFNNNGWKDLFVANGMRRDINDLDYMRLKFEDDIASNSYYVHDKVTLLDSMPRIELSNYMFENKGDLTFAKRTEQWGLGDKVNSNGTAFADLDNDGDLELIVVNQDVESFIYENLSNSLMNNGYLKVKLKGEGANTYGYGTKVTLFHGTTTQYQELSNARGFQSSSEPVVHFGVGQIQLIDSLVIEWVSGKVQSFVSIEINQTLTIDESDTTTEGTISRVDPDPLFTEIQPFQFEHVEGDFSDFRRDRLLPYMMSREGPGLAVADVNGDGYDDIYIGGAAGQSGQLFIQSANGKFTTSKGQPWTETPQYEELGIIFFDANGDGTQDLYIASGSNEFDEYGSAKEDRLFFNDGLGNFQKADILPDIVSSTSSVVAADLDKDQDIDMFIGGRIIPSKYPMRPKSYLLRNDNTSFTEVTRLILPELEFLGMITAALASDFNNDGWPDLILAGDYLPLTFLEHKVDYMDDITESTGLGPSNGWWRSINGGDFDDDGDIDYIAGNHSLNSVFKASEEKPLRVYAGDFDHNNVIDPIITLL